MRYVLVITLVAVLAPAAAAQDKKLDKADADRLAKLIEQLGSKKFQERQAATKAIAEFGQPALEMLQKAAKKTDDLETGRRLGLLIWKLRAPARAEQAKQIAKLILKLNSDRFEDREAATKELVTVGQPALSQLYEATLAPDVELVRRAQSIIDKIARD